MSGVEAAFVFGDFNSQLLLRGIMREADGYTVTCSIRVGAVNVPFSSQHLEVMV